MRIDNNVFCALPFTYLYVDSLNEYKLCSDSRLSSKINTNQKSIIEYFNSKYLNEIRDDMLNGVLSEKIKGTCIRCIEREQLGSWSRRVKDIDKSIIENYKLKFLNIPTNKTIKLKFGNLCNLKCLTCGPYSSSRWAKERNTVEELDIFKELKESINQESFKKYGSLYQSSFDHEFTKNLEHYNYNFNENFYDELKLLMNNIENIIVSGGEPFINDNFYDFLHWLIDENYSRKIKLTVFSNLTHMPKNYKLYYDKFKSFTINISIDGVGKKDEYIRTGTVFEKKHKNICEVVKNFTVNFTATLSMLNVGYQKNLIEYCLQFDKNPSFFNVLVEPFYLQITNLPNDIIEIYQNKGEYHSLFFSKQKNLDHFKIGINYLKKYDIIHNTNLLEEWPEFEKYYT